MENPVKYITDNSDFPGISGTRRVISKLKILD